MKKSELLSPRWPWYMAWLLIIAGVHTLIVHKDVNGIVYVYFGCCWWITRWVEDWTMTKIEEIESRRYRNEP